MNGNTEILYWRTNKNWFTINCELDRYELTDAAPERAKKSFEEWKKLNNLNY